MDEAKKSSAPIELFEPSRSRRIAAVIGAVFWSLAALGIVVLWSRGWMLGQDAVLAVALFGGAAGLHAWAVTQFATLRLTATTIEMSGDRAHTQQWSDVRLVAADARRIKLDTPSGPWVLYPDAFTDARGMRQALLTKLRAGRTA
jgi:hypothetical protein